MGLSISRYWGQEPHWFESLPHEIRVELVADYMLSHEDTKEGKAKASEARVEAFHAQRRVFVSEGAINE